MHALHAFEYIFFMLIHNAVLIHSWYMVGEKRRRRRKRKREKKEERKQNKKQLGEKEKKKKEEENVRHFIMDRRHRLHAMSDRSAQD